MGAVPPDSALDHLDRGHARTLAVLLSSQDRHRRGQRRADPEDEHGDFNGAAKQLAEKDSLETNVVLVGLNAYAKGPESVEDLISGALGRERGRYERRLGFLATLASNAPYIGLFGTVLGIIRSFRDLSANMSEASSSVMGGIAEALVATAVGLLVAIPAVVAYNSFRARVKTSVTNCQQLSRIVLAELKANETTTGGATADAAQ